LQGVTTCKTGLASQGTYGQEQEVFKSLQWTNSWGPRIKLDRQLHLARNLMGRKETLEHDLVRTGQKAIVHCEGTSGVTATIHPPWLRPFVGIDGRVSSLRCDSI
jgi:hypothetical protein